MDAHRDVFAPEFLGGVFRPVVGHAPLHAVDYFLFAREFLAQFHGDVLFDIFFFGQRVPQEFDVRLTKTAKYLDFFFRKKKKNRRRVLPILNTHREYSIEPKISDQLVRHPKLSYNTIVQYITFKNISNSFEISKILHVDPVTIITFRFQRVLCTHAFGVVRRRRTRIFVTLLLPPPTPYRYTSPMDRLRKYHNPSLEIILNKYFRTDICNTNA